MSDKKNVIDPDNPYTRMQTSSYARGVYMKTVEQVMNGEDAGSEDHFGPLDRHEATHTLLFQRGIALDLGCGVGRAIVRYADRFERIDGVDLSLKNIKVARKYCASKELNPKLYINNGVDLHPIADNTYDVVFSIQVFPHIAVHEIRYSLMKEAHRVLKPNGWLCIQMGYGDSGPGGRRLAGYYDNEWDAKGTNGWLDCTITDPSQPKHDIEEIGFRNFSYSLTPMEWKHANHHQWIYFRGQKCQGDRT